MKPRAPTLLATLAALIVGLIPNILNAQQKILRFEDYPVREIYRGKNAPVVMNRSTRTFKTRLREAAREKPNFAGRYILTTWGCGTGCQLGAVIDAPTGKVHWLPFAVSADYDTDSEIDPIQFQLTSKLIIFNGYRADRDEEPGTRYYKFQNGRFVFLRFEKKSSR